MESTMKNITLILLISLSGLSHGTDKLNVFPSLSVSPIVVQQALASGVTFLNSQEEYQLILGGRAFNKNNNINSNTSSLSGNANSNNLWTGEQGSFLLSIVGNDTSTNSASASMANSNFNQIAYNPRSGQIGVIIGDIVVKLRPYYRAETIANIFNINLITSFENINTAIFRIKPGQNIFTIAEQLSGYVGVEFAEIDIIDNLNQLL
jgi:hypothetical protein|tara:strand:+ start:1940 stop:2560 length:621 start_codon:yes stop_codon:yes gene_type:complete